MRKLLILALLIHACAGLPPASLNAPLNVTALADGLIVADGSMALGSAVLNSASGLFAPSSVGKTISVQYAGGTAGSNQPLTTTIASYSSPTRVTLGATALQDLSAAGVIWGTDNYGAFDSWVTALPGRAGNIPCPSAGGIFLVNLAGETKTLNLGSNETISQDKACAIAIVGVNLATPGGLFSIPAATKNLSFTNAHFVGEWQNEANNNAIPLGFGAGSGFYSENAGGSSNIQILSPLFENLLGMGVKEFNTNDSNLVVKNVTCKNVGDTCLNVNSGTTTIDTFLCTGVSSGVGGCIEASGASSVYTNGTSYFSLGQYAMAFGGLTSGSPVLGNLISNNKVYNFLGSQGCFSIGDGFSSTIVSKNGCFSPGGPNQFGFVNVKSGSVATDNNVFDSNVVIGGASAFYVSRSNGDSFTNNTGTGAAFEINLAAGVTGVKGTGNKWNAIAPAVCGGCKDIALAEGVSASLKDRAANCTIGGGGSLTEDSLVTDGTAICFGLAPLPTGATWKLKQP